MNLRSPSKVMDTIYISILLNSKALTKQVYCMTKQKATPLGKHPYSSPVTKLLQTLKEIQINTGAFSEKHKTFAKHSTKNNSLYQEEIKTSATGWNWNTKNYLKSGYSVTCHSR